MLAPFEQGWIRTGPREAGFSDHPADRGGPTKWGVTERVAREDGYTGDMRDLTEDRAKVIAKKRYWDVLNLDEVAAISPPIAMEMFDTIYNGGDSGAWLQRSLNVLNQEGRIYPDMKVDGRIGPATLSALRAYIVRRGKEGEQVMLEALNHIQGERFIRIAEGNPSQEAFVYGWLFNRASMKS